MKNRSSSESFRPWSLSSLSRWNAVQRLKQRFQRPSKERSGRERCNSPRHNQPAESLIVSSSETPQVRVEPSHSPSFSPSIPFSQATPRYRPLFTYGVGARLHNDDPGRRRFMLASLDTQCECNLMSSRMWDRLMDGRQLQLEPCTSVVLPLDSAPLPVLGIARNVTWHLLVGPHTYIDDFLVIDMERYDLLIGSETILREDLLTLRRDLSFRRSRVPTDLGSVNNSEL